ncbi:MAG: TlpA family protein disulfide reductase [Methylophilaceae bacterium]|jgi:thiol-disulfide isomerase/thioredoxin|nr:MAG: TlpA family protein disulfide reductase [Methylophilaceae bacterium]
MMSYKRKITAALTLLILIAWSGYTLLQKSEIDDIVFVSIKGEAISMASLRGKVVLVNFWATDCKSCVTEMPDLIQTYHQYQPKGLEIIAVAMPYDPPAQVVNFASQKALPFPVIHDSYAEITRTFGGVKLTPTAYIYNKEGKRIQHAVGAFNFNKLHALLDKELN